MHHILEAKLSKANIKTITQAQYHFQPQQQDQLKKILQKHQKLTDGTIGFYNKRKFHINLKSNTTPYYCNIPFPVPQ